MTRKPSTTTRAKHSRLLEQAKGKSDRAESAVNRWVIDNGHGHVKWSELEPIARRQIPQLMAERDAALTEEKQVEESAITAWTHYRGTYGLLFPVAH